VNQTSLSHRAYQAVIAIKGLDGALETIAGLILAFAGSQRIYDFLIAITAPEIESHPASHTAHMVRHGAESLLHASHTFIVFYLLAHGMIKLGIAAALLRETVRWVFPVAVAVLGLFVLFMLHRLTHHWSDWLLAFALFDVVTIGLVLNEWRRVSKAGT